MIKNIPTIAVVAKYLTRTASSSITTIAAVTQLSFTATVTGAVVGDIVIATPVTAVITNGCSYFGKVTSADTITIYVNNSSAASNTLTAGTWNITVLQGVVI